MGVKQLKDLECVYQCLIRIMADQDLDIAMFKEVIREILNPTLRLAAVKYSVTRFLVSEPPDMPTD
jgi:hypothetical protein